ncbi:DUF4221 family protein [Mongoliitalea daihaiensis]|uniref:DUF4221 family protein n=1 Tax=Mongoliitalea daihaiensis TaxID=2782006 RepID=UPI001F27B5B4|nr:DUF4221 family protein [Mongoliitalea daihaiensis]UJP66013.1 DUF4221 family protein [Mongoliitalea daihaiensis]
MKKIICILLSGYLFACQSSEKDTIDSFASFELTIDTVMVDSKDEILMAAVNSFSHSYTLDSKTLINWSFDASELEMVDLEKFELVKKVRIEKEGPDGVGPNAYQFQLLSNDRYAFIGWDDKIVITDSDGKVVDRLSLDKPWMLEQKGEKESLSFLGFSEDGNTIFCKFLNFETLNPDVLALDLVNESSRIIPMPVFQLMDKYKVKWTSDDGRSMSMWHPSHDMLPWKSELLFFTNALNSIYKYSMATDSLSLWTYENQLTASSKTGTYKNETSSMEEMRAETAKIYQEVTFTLPLWDEQKQVFYRISYLDLPKVGEDPVKKRVFLSVLSPNFELLGEKELTMLSFDKTPSPKFVKDGKLYLYLNLEDELAYIRVSIND